MLILGQRLLADLLDGGEQRFLVGGQQIFDADGPAELHRLLVILPQAVLVAVLLVGLGDLDVEVRGLQRQAVGGDAQIFAAALPLFCIGKEGRAAVTGHIHG